MVWKFFSASVRGTSHERNDTPKQDYCLTEVYKKNDLEYIIAAVADGAGSASRSDASSKFICKYFIRNMKNWISEHEMYDLDRDTVASWFTGFKRIMERAVKFKMTDAVREFSTTLLLSVLSDDDKSIFIQIGDGAISVGSKTRFECVFWPQNGEFMNTTLFATDRNVEDTFMFKKMDRKISRVAMHTDGIEIISLNFAEQRPFVPFFNPFFSALEKMQQDGYSDGLSKQLGAFLASDKVNQKTDDDKTVVFISRCVGDFNDVEYPLDIYKFQLPVTNWGNPFTMENILKKQRLDIEYNARQIQDISLN
ncbi:MAG: protein phosphatase 2C domain-containing protein [Cyanobacteria bacterium RUI128]|nr:protein phosphatase 2C domain-containing protein [Cyanobacteria bacterium RUI128]